MRPRQFVCVALTLSTAAAPGLAQESKALFDAPLAVVPSDNRIEHLVDFDGDGWMDLLSWWRVSINSPDIQVRGWRNEAGAKFTQAWEVTLGGQGALADGRLAVGDIDGDGDLDFAAEFRQQVRVYACDGFEEPTVVNTKNFPAPVADMAFVDFDNNGFADLVVRESNGALKVHRNSGPAAGWAQPLVSTTALLPEVSQMQVGELNGDGVDDLLFVVPNVIQFVRLQPDGSVAGSSYFVTASAWPSPRPAIGDLDGDGDDDIVVWDGAAPNGYYEILRRNGPSSWTLEPVRAGGPATELADIDLDGDLDGICCGGSGSNTWLNGIESTFNICHNLGGGVFTPSFQMRGIGSKHIAGAADIDHDGDVDLIAGRAIYYPRGMLTASPGLLLPAPLAFESGLVDFDDDGDRDLNLDVAAVLRSNGQHEFSSVAPRLPDAPAGSSYHGPGYTGDFDGDGDVDWIVARADGGVFAQMELMKNLGEGTFVYGGAAGPSGVSFSLDAPLQLDARSFFTGDVDGDGDLDLLTRSMPTIPSMWRTQVWLNDGSGMFSPGVNLIYTSVMAVAHLNGDAHLDMVVASYHPIAQQLLSAWFGAGNGTFPSGTILPATVAHRSAGPHETLAVLDIDADGDLDIAAVTQATDGWGWLRRWTNNGSGVFTEAWTDDYHFCHTFGNSTTAAHVLADDVNGDGFDDLVLWPAKEGQSGSWILLRSSSGTGFEPPLLQGVQPLVLDDVDSDGDADVIGRGPSGLDNMRVLSRAIEGPAVGARRQYGEGTGAPSGCVPLLGAVGPFRVGSTMQLRMRGGVGGATGYIALSALEAATPATPFPGMTLYVGQPLRKLPIKLDGPLGVPCVGEKTRQFVIPPGYAGRTLFHQLVLNDASAPNGVVCSNGLEISYD